MSPGWKRSGSGRALWGQALQDHILTLQDHILKGPKGFQAVAAQQAIGSAWLCGLVWRSFLFTTWPDCDCNTLPAGDMLRDPQLVYYNAEVMAQRWREEQAWRLNQEETGAQVGCNL